MVSCSNTCLETTHYRPAASRNIAPCYKIPSMPNDPDSNFTPRSRTRTKLITGSSRSFTTSPEFWDQSLLTMPLGKEALRWEKVIDLRSQPTYTRSLESVRATLNDNQKSKTTAAWGMTSSGSTLAIDYAASILEAYGKRISFNPDERLSREAVF